MPCAGRAQRRSAEKIMKQPLVLLVVLIALAGGLLFLFSPGHRETPAVAVPAGDTRASLPAPVVRHESPPDRAVLDISVHTLDELRVLLDRAEDLSSRLLETRQDASVVLVLHGPEVEFFSKKNYDRYRDIVDQAARLDALQVVDVKICQTMMTISGVARDDIPAFIEQVPDGRVEVERLRNEGYVYF
jgi:intracellular sulfur oxidation DsrE/DsrF family protein